MSTEDLDHYGRPKAEYFAAIRAMDNDGLYTECGRLIRHWTVMRESTAWIEDYPWMISACFEEAKRREGGLALYARAFDDA